MEVRQMVQAGEGMRRLLLPTAYLAPVSYYAALYHSTEVVIEAHEHYVKQTLRNRCTIATDQGRQTLSAYVERGNSLHTPISQIRISSHNDWQRQHLYAWATYYGQSPFYEYYIDELREVFLNGHDGTLMGMNEALRRHLCREIGFEPNVRYSTEWMGPQPPLPALSEPLPYYQVAGAEGKQPFMNDVSILDLLFNMGPESLLIIDKCKII